MPVFEHETTFDCSVEGLFNFLIRPENVVQVSNPDLQIRFESAPDVLNEGDVLKFQIVTFGRITKITHRISRIVTPSIVIEEQVEGPLKLWKHTHEYVASDGGVLKRDRVDFEPPGGLVGFFLTEDKVIEQLEDGMYIREQRLNEFISQGIIV